MIIYAKIYFGATRLDYIFFRRNQTKPRNSLTLCGLLLTRMWSSMRRPSTKTTSGTSQIYTLRQQRVKGVTRKYRVSITMTSWWARWRLKSLVLPLCTQPFIRRSNKISKLRVTGLCAGNSPGTGEFPAQMASNAENVSIWWRHHECSTSSWHGNAFCITGFVWGTHPH